MRKSKKAIVFITAFILSFSLGAGIAFAETKTGEKWTTKSINGIKYTQWASIYTTPPSNSKLGSVTAYTHQYGNAKVPQDDTANRAYICNTNGSVYYQGDWKYNGKMLKANEEWKTPATQTHIEHGKKFISWGATSHKAYKNGKPEWWTYSTYKTASATVGK